MIRFTCPNCGIALKAHDGTEGERSRCPCGQPFIVPSDRIEAYAVDFRTARTFSRTVAEQSPSDNEDFELELGLEMARQKRERTLVAVEDQFYRDSDSIDILVLFLSLGGLSSFVLFWLYPICFVTPAIGLSLFAVCTGMSCKTQTNVENRRTKAGVAIALMVLAVLFLILVSLAASEELGSVFPNDLNPKK